MFYIIVVVYLLFKNEKGPSNYTQHAIFFSSRFTCLLAHCLLHAISTGCVARDLYKIAPGPLERMCWTQFTAQ